MNNLLILTLDSVGRPLCETFVSGRS